MKRSPLPHPSANISLVCGHASWLSLTNAFRLMGHHTPCVWMVVVLGLQGVGVHKRCRSSNSDTDRCVETWCWCAPPSYSQRVASHHTSVQSPLARTTITPAPAPWLSRIIAFITNRISAATHGRSTPTHPHTHTRIPFMWPSMEVLTLLWCGANARSSPGWAEAHTSC
jgi:hypothetical protein